MRITLYVHGSKESAYEAGQQAGLTGKALDYFMYAAYEHALEYEVDKSSGNAELLSIDGRKVAPK